MKNTILYVFFWVGLIFLIGCDSLTSSSKENKPAVSNPDLLRSNTEVINSISSEDIISLDQKFAEIAAGIPGFGGIFFDENGRLTIYQKNPAAISSVNSALALLPGLSTAVKTNVKILEADFDFVELQNWRLLIRREALGQNSVISLDIDETKNRIAVGVADSTKIFAVTEEIAEYNIPANAFEVIKVMPFETQQGIPTGPQGNSLAEEVDPKAGGLLIERLPTNSSSSIGTECTMGFNVLWYNSQTGINEKGFVTNSHCTNSQGFLESTEIGQHTNASANLVGTEVEDPSYFSGTNTYNYTCPNGFRCRLSDSALIDYVPGINAPIGRIYKTNLFGTGNESGSVIHNRAMFTITQKGSYPYAGQTLNKMGYRSGWTRGNVSSTCLDAEDTRRDGTRIMNLCQGVVNANVREGDSGSPVFRQIGTNTVSLEGIVWGRRVLNGVVQFAFSLIASVTQELSITAVY